MFKKKINHLVFEYNLFISMNDLKNNVSKDVSVFLMAMHTIFLVFIKRILKKDHPLIN